MPHAIHRRKRGLSNNVQNKLATRLMQISLRMDDHIYHNMPVSRDAAEEFLQEVQALKLKCPRKDVRSLQVIDKISALMKKIIAGSREQVTNLSPTIQAYAGFSQSHSPVYSLPDEDRTESDTLCSDVAIIDITEQSSDSEQHNAIENVNSSISNMSIQDDNLIQVRVLSDDACSQSILDSYYNGNEVYNDGDNLDTLHMTDPSNKTSITPASNELSHHSENATLCATISNQIVSTEKGIENIKQNINDFGKEILVSNLSIDQKVTPKEQKNTAQRKKSKDIKKAIKKRKPNSANFNTAGTTEMNSKPNKVNKYKKTKKENKSITAVSRDSGVNGAMKIYNQNVENDLSWVENLRYVREIGPDENDLTLYNLGDNFWDDFSLPNQWNDLDFYA